MSGLEIVGLIGAIPGVVKLITESITLIHRCRSSKKLSSVGKGAHLQLEAIKDLLIALDARCKDNKKGPRLLGDVQNVKQIVKELGDELENLTKLLNSVALACTKGEGRIVRRAHLLFSGYESHFKEQFQRIEAIKSLLILIITNGINVSIDQALEDSSERRRKPILDIKTALQPCKPDIIQSKLPRTLDLVPVPPDVTISIDPSSVDLSGRAICIYGVKEVQLHSNNYDGVAYRVRETHTGDQEFTNDPDEPLRNAALYKPGLSYMLNPPDVLKRFANYLRVLDLSNPRSDFEGEFLVRERNDKKIVNHESRIELDFTIFGHKAELNDVKGQNCQQAVYLSLLNLRPDKSVHLVTRNIEVQRPHPTEPGYTTTKLFKILFPKTHSDVSEVVDILKVIVTDKPLLFPNHLETDEAWQCDATGLVDFDRVLGQILGEADSGEGNAMSQLASRGNSFRPKGIKWQTFQFSLIVTKSNYVS